ncbi:hypothetical protein IG3_05811 [Bacillus cereus HuA2-1]|uniref:Uncharacterized protein n=1 Tax=Bacillus cereus HuA2-1 TaxID=1053201 RepID=J9BJQ0_BACCE|nr:hypothetical protein IG3_05811 [Bacillus cereus HuA2-1]
MNNLKNFLNENLFIKYSLYIILGAGLIRTGYEFGYFIGVAPTFREFRTLRNYSVSFLTYRLIK